MLPRLTLWAVSKKKSTGCPVDRSTHLGLNLFERTSAVKENENQLANQLEDNASRENNWINHNSRSTCTSRCSLSACLNRFRVWQPNILGGLHAGFLFLASLVYRSISCWVSLKQATLPHRFIFVSPLQLVQPVRRIEHSIALLGFSQKKEFEFSFVTKFDRILEFELTF